MGGFFLHVDVICCVIFTAVWLFLVIFTAVWLQDSGSMIDLLNNMLRNLEEFVLVHASLKSEGLRHYHLSSRKVDVRSQRLLSMLR